MTISNIKSAIDYPINRKYAFANVSYVYSLKQPSTIRRPANIPAYFPENPQNLLQWEQDAINTSNYNQ